jgi:hypothetical protein
MKTVLPYVYDRMADFEYAFSRAIAWRQTATSAPGRSPMNGVRSLRGREYRYLPICISMKWTPAIRTPRRSFQAEGRRTRSTKNCSGY